MSDQSLQSPQPYNISSTTLPKAEQLPPPNGDTDKAEQYITKLIKLIDTDKLLASHTDLSKFDPTSLQDHYRLDLKDYEIEISHTKQADTGQDSYIVLFNNLKYVNDKYTEKVILAYLHLTQDQFNSFKKISDDQIERKRKEAEAKRFKEAMQPVEQILEELDATPSNELVDDEIKDDEIKTEHADSPDQIGQETADKLPSSASVDDASTATFVAS